MPEKDVPPLDSVFFNRPTVAVVTWNPTSAAVDVEWCGWADSTEYAAVLEAGLRALTEHHGSRWLADSRRQKVIRQSDQDWANRDWFPRALAAGLRRMAVVVANRGLAQSNVEAILVKVPVDKLEVGYFATVEQATVWLTGSSTGTPDHLPVQSISQG